MIGYIKRLVTKKLVKKYVGSWVRGALRIASGYLLAKGLANPEVADAFAQSSEHIVLASVDMILNNPELLGSLLSGSFAQWWSIKEKKDSVKEKEDE